MCVRKIFKCSCIIVKYHLVVHIEYQTDFVFLVYIQFIQYNFAPFVFDTIIGALFLMVISVKFLKINRISL